jgi:hypothetical protein
MNDCNSDNDNDNNNKEKKDKNFSLVKITNKLKGLIMIML